jgi:hypothetical protein
LQGSTFIRALCVSALFVPVSACVDAPITPEHLEADGTLRNAPLEQAAFSARDHRVPQRAVQLSAVLAAQAEGPIEDASQFAADVGAVHLHVRVDGEFDPRAVVIRWTHDDVSVDVPGFLAPTHEMSRAASSAVAPGETGQWTVEIIVPPTEIDQEPPVLFRREFEIVPP